MAVWLLLLLLLLGGGLGRRHLLSGLPVLLCSGSRSRSRSRPRAGASASARAGGAGGAWGRARTGSGGGGWGWAGAGALGVVHMLRCRACVGLTLTVGVVVLLRARKRERNVKMTHNKSARCQQITSRHKVMNHGMLFSPLCTRHSIKITSCNRTKKILEILTSIYKIAKILWSTDFGRSK